MSAVRVRVLIVGDDAGANSRVLGALTPRYACEVAATAESGLAAFGSEPFDVVVADDLSGSFLRVKFQRSGPGQRLLCIRSRPGRARGGLVGFAGRFSVRGLCANNSSGGFGRCNGY